MKKQFTVLTALVLAVLLCACDIGGKRYTPLPTPDASPAVSEEPQESPEPEELPIEIAAEYREITFDQFTGQRLRLSSPAGDWETVINVTRDGYFGGQYLREESTHTGITFPKGTRYISNFYGSFTQPEKINDYTWLTTVRELSYYHEPGTEETGDEILYSYTSACGLSAGDFLLIYVPGAPMRELPEECLRWIGTNDAEALYEQTLDSFLVYNDNQKMAFISYTYHDPSTVIVSGAEKKASEINRYIEENELENEAKEQKAEELFLVWDQALNDIWAELNRTLDEKAMDKVLQEEIDWIRVKDTAIEAVEEEFKDKPFAGIAVNTAAAQYTQERVYELYAIIQNTLEGD